MALVPALVAFIIVLLGVLVQAGGEEGVTAGHEDQPRALQDGAERIDPYRYPPAAAARPGAGDTLAGEPAPATGSSAVATVMARRPARSRALCCGRASLP